MNISIQGIKGAFHEEAARLYFSNEIKVVEKLMFEDVIYSVEHKEAYAGVMAIENSISGTIHSNFELIKQSNLYIVGEVYLKIVQNLAVNEGVGINDLKQVESHYMAINQCRSFFRNHPNIKLVDTEDTALSMKNVAKSNSTSIGAIGSKLAAAYYGLKIINSSIETNKKNFTRFFVLKTNPSISKHNNKSSMLVVLKNQKGALANALNCINNSAIDLSKIESLPIIGEPWHYQFYIEVLYKSELDYEKMKTELKIHVENISELGCYIENNITEAKQAQF